MHLDDHTYRELLAGTLRPELARELARHLEKACERCERFLAERPGADALDGRADANLARLAPAGGAGNDIEFARILRTAAESPRGRRRLVPAMAAAAAVLAAGLAGVYLAHGPRHERPVWNGLKGTTSEGVPIRLRFLVVDGAGGTPALEKGVSGQAVPAAASLQFQLDLGRAAEVALVRVPARGAPEIFYRERLGSGRVDVGLGGAPAAYPLAQLAGPQRFVAIASDEPISPDRITRAAAALAPPPHVSAETPGLDGLSLDVVEVTVR
jgi:hypothetical protein